MIYYNNFKKLFNKSNLEGKKMEQKHGVNSKHLLFFIFGMTAIFCVFVYLLSVQQTKQERWGVSPQPESAKLEPESSADKILKNIFDVQKAIHKVVPDGQYQGLQQNNIFGFDSPFKVPILNRNYKVVGAEFGIVLHILATPEACSEVSHSLLDNDRIVDVNGFEPGGKGVLASKVIDSCKSGKLIVKVP